MASAQMVIDGRFELLERLGSGGMGTVWRAHDLALHREVALKEVQLAGAETPGDDSTSAQMLRERVLREARALARLDHPNVVTIHHIVDSPGMPHPWIVMELVRGRSLQDRLAQGPLAPAEAALVGRGILAALRAAHEAGIFHRDVKPANVLLRTDGSPVLTDFGIAALRESPRVTATGGLVGSPQYIAPERLHGEEGHPASDFWSLGMLLYVAVEGRHPIRHNSPAAVLAAVMSGAVPPPQMGGPLTPVITALLVPDPAARPSAEQLDHMLAQAAGQAPPPMANPMPVSGPMPVASPMPGGGPMPGVTPLPFPAPGSYAPPPPGFGTTAPSLSHRSGGWSGAVIAAVVVAVALMVTVPVAAVVVLPKLLDGGDGKTPAGSGPRGGVPSTNGAASNPAPDGNPEPGSEKTPESGSMLTPARIRSVIGELEKATGGTEFTSFTVYDQYAIAEAPVRGKRNLYDRWTYRDGQATRSAGGTLDSDDGKVKLSSFNWAALPKLFQTADRVLGVPKPTMRYVIVDPSWTFANDQPVMMVYLTDDYGGAYLAANRNGKVLTKVPRKN